MRLVLAASALLVAACSAMEPTACSDGERPGVTETLYFGTGRAGAAPVSEDEWASFLREVVTPRFPEGFTAWPASGQWRGSSGAIVAEKSFVLSILHAPGKEAQAKVDAIAALYKSRFRQEAVLRVASRGCFAL